MIKNNNILYLALIPVLLITILVVYFIGRGSGKNAAKVNDGKELDKDIDTNQLSYPLSSYKQFADTLHVAMLGLGTDFTGVKKVFTKIKNQSDLFQLLKSFGTRGSYIDYGLYNALVFSGDLTRWLNDELSETEKSQIINLLETNNITFTI